jgi:hypothetical protein
MRHASRKQLFDHFFGNFGSGPELEQEGSQCFRPTGARISVSRTTVIRMKPLSLSARKLYIKLLQNIRIIAMLFSSEGVLHSPLMDTSLLLFVFH